MKTLDLNNISNPKEARSLREWFDHAVSTCLASRCAVIGMRRPKDDIAEWRLGKHGSPAMDSACCENSCGFTRLRLSIEGM